MIREEESKLQGTEIVNSRLVHWFLTNRNSLLIALSAIIICSIFFVWLINHKRTQRYQQLQEAELLAEELEKNAPLFEATGISNSQSTAEIVTKLRAINDSTPDLQNRYDGLIAQELLIENAPSQPYAERSIQRLKTSGLVSFAEFSDIAVLSEQKEYGQALEKSLKLRAEKNLPYPLEANLLLQIAALQKALGQTNAVKQTTSELKSLLGIGAETRTLTKKEKEFAAAVLSQIQEKDEFLLNYLQN